MSMSENIIEFILFVIKKIDSKIVRLFDCIFRWLLRLELESSNMSIRIEDREFSILNVLMDK